MRPTSPTRPTSMHIQATRPFWLSGAVVPVGTVLALPTVLAAELVHNGKAQACAAPASAPTASPAATPATPASKAKPADKATTVSLAPAPRA